MPYEEHMGYVMDRSTIWKAAHRLLKDAEMSYEPRDVVVLAEFLAGDNVMSPLEEIEGDDEQQSTDGRVEGTE